MAKKVLLLLFPESEIETGADHICCCYPGHGQNRQEGVVDVLQQGFQERQANSSRAVCTENIDPLQPGYSTATSLSLSSCLGRGKATEPLMPHGQFRKRRDYDRGTLELLQKLRAQTWETNYLTDLTGSRLASRNRPRPDMVW